MTRRAYGICAVVAALVAALALCACDVPAAGKPMLYADQIAADETDVSEPIEDESAETDDDFSPVASVGEGAVYLRLENHLGATITSISLRDSGTEEWTAGYVGLSIPNGSPFELRVDATPADLIDFRFEGADGTTFLMLGSNPASVAMDRNFDDVVMLRYDKGVTYMEYVNRFGLGIDTHLSAQEAFESMREQFEGRGETFVFTERDMEGVEAGQETENCLD